MQTNKVVKEELDDGGCVFIICPLVEERAKDLIAGIKAAEEGAAKWSAQGT